MSFSIEPESKIHLVVPGLGWITIAGSTAFVAKVYEIIRGDYGLMLAKALQSFTGALVMTETPLQQGIDNQ